MRNPARIGPMIQALADYWTAHPDLRLGQIIDNTHALSRATADLFYVEDSPLLAGLVALAEHDEPAPINSSTEEA